MSMAALCTPLRLEHAALRGAARSMRLIRTGMGPRRAARTAATLSPTDPVLVAGLAAAQSPHLHPGDLVVATEVRTATTRTALRLPNSTAELLEHDQRTLLLSSGGSVREVEPAEAGGGIEIPSAPLLAGALRRLGLRVHAGPICSVPRIAWGTVADGVLAVDMESAQLAPAGGPFAVVRAIVDTPEHPLWHIGTLHRGIAALRTLRAGRPALEWWAAATGPRQVLLAAPRAVRAIARQVDLMLVIGSPHSVRLVKDAQLEGVPAYLVDDVSEIDLRWLAGTRRLGITAGAPQLVAEIVHCLRGLGPVSVRESAGEDVALVTSKEVI